MNVKGLQVIQTEADDIRQWQYKQLPATEMHLLLVPYLMLSVLSIFSTGVQCVYCQDAWQGSCRHHHRRRLVLAAAG